MFVLLVDAPRATSVNQQHQPHPTRQGRPERVSVRPDFHPLSFRSRLRAVHRPQAGFSAGRGAKHRRSAKGKAPDGWCAPAVRIYSFSTRVGWVDAALCDGEFTFGNLDVIRVG